MGNFSKLAAGSVLVLVLVIVMPAARPAGARVSSGICSDCHTMHNSQNGLSMKKDDTPIVGGGGDECFDCHAELRPEVLRLDCLGCHAQNPAGGANIIDGIPQIAHSAATDLAAGNYRYVFYSLYGNDADSHGHNVHGFGNADISSDFDLANNPPGYNSTFDPSFPSTGGYQASYANDTIMCAGRNGCHGDRNQQYGAGHPSQTKAMAGTHHYNDSMLKFGSINEGLQGSHPGSSYRFLYGVHGGEDADWQNTKGAADHNEYRGANLPAAPGSFPDVVTISTLCAECHGNFHSVAGTGGASPWLRHPNDFTIPNEAPYTDYTIYNTTVPVGRLTVPAAASGTVTAGTDLVICLSCHQAHASPYPDILRWDYTNNCAMGVANPNCGCFTCHTDKD